MSDSADLITSANSHAEPVLGIVVALPEELATLTRRKLARGQSLDLGNCWIAYSGAGMSNAAQAARQLLEKGAGRLISWGCAAGLAENAKPGDLVLADAVVTAQQTIPADVAWATELQQNLPALTIHRGSLYTSDSLVGRSLDKRALHRQNGALALDMESAAVAEVARQVDIPFNVVRTVADPVDMDLPNAVVQALDVDGQVSLPKLLTYLLTHAGEIPALIRLGLHFQAAQKTLKTVARELRRRQILPS